MPRESIKQAIRIIGSGLDKLLGNDFSVIDTTAFTNWHQDTQSFHLINRISAG